jgi:hypothetical protein
VDPNHGPVVHQFDFELAQLDIKTAFLHGELDKEIYMSQPTGYRVADNDKRVCKLKKSLYGLKQSPRQWYKRFTQFMLGQGYTRSPYDPCVYFRKVRDGSFIYLLLYVDDMLIVSKSIREIDNLKKTMSMEFEMKDLGEARKILGMEIVRDRESGRVWLSQKAYLQKVLQRFSQYNIDGTVSIPLSKEFKLDASMSPKSDKERKEMSSYPYASAVGSLMYAMVCTRPDISHAVGTVSRYMHDPGERHWEAVKWILRYIQGSDRVGLLFQKGRDLSQLCTGFVDSDYDGQLERRRSTTGYVFTLVGGPISWRSTLQSIVALSSTQKLNTWL